MDYKKSNAPTSTVTRDMNTLAEKTGNVYETVRIIAKRANQISVDIKTELDKKVGVALDAHPAGGEFLFCLLIGVQTCLQILFIPITGIYKCRTVYLVGIQRTMGGIVMYFRGKHSGKRSIEQIISFHKIEILISIKI